MKNYQKTMKCQKKTPKNQFLPEEYKLSAIVKLETDCTGKMSNMYKVGETKLAMSRKFTGPCAYIIFSSGLDGFYQRKI